MRVDPIPDHSNRLAYWIGLALHPAVMGAVTLFLVLRDLSLDQAISWTALVSAVLVLPGTAVIVLLKRHQRFTYQRQSRLPLYVTAWVSVLVAALLVHTLNGPPVLLPCLATLVVWLPLQLLINQTVTKISTHVGVVSGCVMGLVLLGKVPLIAGSLLWIAVVLLMGWARITTKNHTLLQVILGAIVGGGSALLAIPLFL